LGRDGGFLSPAFTRRLPNQQQAKTIEILRSIARGKCASIAKDPEG
jgi:hypothetical protein